MDKDMWHGVLVATCLTLATQLSRRAYHRHGQWCDPSDYESVAMTALGVAVAVYNAEDMQGRQFLPFCNRRIRNALVDYWREAHGRTTGRHKGWRRYEQSGHDVTQHTHNPWYQVDAAIEIRKLWKHMTPAQQQAVEYLCLRGYTTHEYAAHFHLHPNTGQVMTSHAKRRVRNMSR